MFLIPIPFTMPVMLGWVVFTTRNAAEGEPHPMAEWGAWGDMWLAGAKLFVVMLIYWLPFFLASGLALGVFFAGMAIGGDVGQLIAMVGMLFFYVGVFALSLLGMVMQFTLLPMGQIQVAVHDSIGAGLQFREMWRLFKANPWSILFCGLISWVGGFVASFAIYLCCLPAFPVMVLTYGLTSAGLGQALYQLREGTGTMMEPSSL